ncbi:hypothetical protein [Radiobacillus deserti]|uniref:Uncharacterized protein n=1 Tax=Radiobacillus deserti TaxID=2594883 RepID=A0A516KDA9_9BACI|nr:hypothetical protein [Radiobacillus deserti]QDP39402.1 hypothetical protein FN924_03875 [Radiobacillus deserti]
MKYIKYISIQFILFSLLIFMAYISEPYLQRPFDKVDVIAIVVMAPFVFIVLHFGDKLKALVPSIHVLVRILLTVVAILLAIILIGLVTGELQFSES